jgi:glycosyltransferase involved in cell wall biosynthesis
MKIVYFIDHLRPDGAQFVMRQLVQHMGAQGHEQAVVCLNDSWDQVLVNHLRAAGADVYVVGKAPLASGVGLGATWLWLRQRRFDVAVTMLFAADVLGRALAHIVGIPHIVTSLQTHNANYPWWKRWLVQQTMPYADMAVLTSPTFHTFAITQEGASSDKLCYIPNSVNTDLYRDPLSRAAMRVELGLSPDRYLIGSVGRLTYQKGFDVLFNALGLLPRKDFDLLIAGTGELEDELRSLAAELGLQQRIHFVGYRRDVGRLFGALDLYVHPSRFEGMPIAVLEAMAANRSIVTTAVDGNCQLIEDGVHGWLVQPEDPRSLANAIDAALNNPIEARERADAARQRVVEHFSEHVVMASWEKLLCEGTV